LTHSRSKRWLATTVWLCLVGLPNMPPGTVAHAQTMIRCGNIYQDHPCENGVSEKVIGKINREHALPKPPADAICIKRGIDAQKMVWAREGGTTLEQAQQEALNNDQRELVLEVYHNRTSAPETRAAVEAACMEEKSLAWAKAAEALATPAERKAAKCAAQNMDLNAVLDQQKRGASGAAGESLVQKQHKINQEMRDTGC